MAKGKGKGGPLAKGKGGSRPLTALQLFEQAQLALQYDDFDTARSALKKAAKMEPSNVEIIDALGALLAEIGPENEALQVLKHAVTLSPDEGYEKYMYLGQLLEDQEALDATRKGVVLLQRTAEAAKASASGVAAGSEEAEEAAAAAEYFSHTLCGALCSLAEMTLNHAEDIASVSGEVEGMLAQAIAVDPSSPEPGQVLASLLYEQGKSEEALASLKQSMALWYKPSKDDDDEEGDEDAMEEADGSGDDDAMDEDSDDDEDEDDGPSYEFRCECAKLLLELDDTTATAIDVLEGLIEENDTDPVAWHLLGLAYYSGHQYSEAQEVLDKGRLLLAKLGVPKDDEVAQLFEELASAIAEAQAMAAGGGEAAAAGGEGGEAAAATEGK